MMEDFDFGLPAPRTGGRPPVPTPTTTRLRNMILEALDEAGGVGYLVQVAREEPQLFIALLGKVLPAAKFEESSAPSVLEIRRIIEYLPPVEAKGSDAS